jgi:hypothetical protein
VSDGGAPWRPAIACLPKSVRGLKTGEMGERPFQSGNADAINAGYWATSPRLWRTCGSSGGGAKYNRARKGILVL